MNIAKYLRTAFSIEHLRKSTQMYTQKGRRGKRGTKEPEKIFQIKDENENIHLISTSKFWC